MLEVIEYMLLPSGRMHQIVPNMYKLCILRPLGKKSPSLIHFSV